MPTLPGLGCCGSQNANAVCGEFADPTTPDLGQCSPYRTKRDCEAPVIPENPCNDTAAYAEYDPLSPTKWTIIATLYDQLCLPILDDASLPILTQVR